MPAYADEQKRRIHKAGLHYVILEILMKQLSINKLTEKINSMPEEAKLKAILLLIQIAEIDNPKLSRKIMERLK